MGPVHKGAMPALAVEIHHEPDADDADPEQGKVDAAHALISALGLDPEKVDVNAVSEALDAHYDLCKESHEEPDGDEGKEY